MNNAERLWRFNGRATNDPRICWRATAEWHLVFEFRVSGKALAAGVFLQFQLPTPVASAIPLTKQVPLGYRLRCMRLGDFVEGNLRLAVGVQCDDESP